MGLENSKIKVASFTNSHDRIMSGGILHVQKSSVNTDSQILKMIDLSSFTMAEIQKIPKSGLSLRKLLLVYGSQHVILSSNHSKHQSGLELS